MAVTRLDGILAKLGRADEHLETLNDETEAFLKSDPWQIVGELDRDEGAYIFRLRINAQIPLRHATIVGDIAHNLRSSLDHLVWQLVEASGGSAGRTNQFPIARTREEWRDIRLGAPNRLKELRSPTAVAEIQRLQPYRQKNPDGHPLAQLAFINNTDKHRLFLPTLGMLAGVASAYFLATDLELVGGPILPSRPSGFGLEDGAELARVRIDPEKIGPQPYMEMHGIVPPDVSLATSGLRPSEFMGTIAAFIVAEVVPRFHRFLDTPGGV